MNRCTRVFIFTLLVGTVFLPTVIHAQSRYIPNSAGFDASSVSGDFWGTVQSGAIGCASGQLATLAARGIGALTNLLVKSVPTTNATLDTITSCLNSAAYAVGKTMLQKVTDNTLKWVNTGFNGAPLYVKDQQSYINSIYNEQITKYLKKIPEQNSLFGGSIRDTLLSQLTGQQIPEKKNQTTTPEQQAYQDFSNDFRKGGWSAWLNATQNANNNPLGSYLNTVDQIGRDTSRQAATVQQELLQGNGFLSMKRCVEWEVDTSIAHTQSEYNTRCVTTLPSIGGVPGGTVPAPGAPAWCATFSTAVSPTDRSCKRYETTTPGRIIADQLSSVTTSTVRQLEQIDQYNEVLQGFFKNLLTKLFTRGVGGYSTGGIATNFAASSGGPGANVVLDDAGNPVSDTSNLTGLASSNSVMGTFDISRPQQIRTVAQVQYDFINEIKNTQSVLRAITPRLGRLDYCVPGPNPTWKTALESNFSALTAGYNDATADSWGGTKFLHINYSLTDKARNELHPWNDVTVLGTNDTKKYYINFYKLAYQSLIDIFTQNYDYGTTGLSEAFAATATTTAEKDYARGFVVDAQAQVQSLVPFSQTAQEIDDEYENYAATTQQALAELESIRKEVNDIVKRSKTTYIKDMADKGTPVNLSCINRAYIVDESPLVPSTKLNNAIDPIIQQSKDAAEYFYSTLPGQLRFE